MGVVISKYVHHIKKATILRYHCFLNKIMSDVSETKNIHGAFEGRRKVKIRDKRGVSLFDAQKKEERKSSSVSNNLNDEADFCWGRSDSRS